VRALFLAEMAMYVVLALVLVQMVPWGQLNYSQSVRFKNFSKKVFTADTHLRTQRHGNVGDVKYRIYLTYFECFPVIECRFNFYFILFCKNTEEKCYFIK